MPEFITVYITCSNNEESKKIGNILVKKRLAACANIVPEIKSIYWWKNKIEKDVESLLLIKTKLSLYEKIRKVVKENHSYETPTINAIPIIKGDKKYFKWLRESVK
ncbi:divalent-cation tolerance protein CutA [Candidatus Aenigmatarchaeota archaeon]